MDCFHGKDISHRGIQILVCGLAENLIHVLNLNVVIAARVGAVISIALVSAGGHPSVNRVEQIAVNLVVPSGSYILRAAVVLPVERHRDVLHCVSLGSFQQLDSLCIAVDFSAHCKRVGNHVSLSQHAVTLGVNDAIVSIVGVIREVVGLESVQIFHSGGNKTIRDVDYHSLAGQVVVDIFRNVVLAGFNSCKEVVVCSLYGLIIGNFRQILGGCFRNEFLVSKLDCVEVFLGFLVVRDDLESVQFLAEGLHKSLQVCLSFCQLSKSVHNLFLSGRSCQEEFDRFNLLLESFDLLVSVRTFLNLVCLVDKVLERVLAVAVEHLGQSDVVIQEFLFLQGLHGSLQSCNISSQRSQVGRRSVAGAVAVYFLFQLSESVGNVLDAVVHRSFQSIDLIVDRFLHASYVFFHCVRRREGTDFGLQIFERSLQLSDCSGIIANALLCGGQIRVDRVNLTLVVFLGVCNCSVCSSKVFLQFRVSSLQVAFVRFILFFCSLDCSVCSGNVFRQLVVSRFQSVLCAFKSSFRSGVIRSLLDFRCNRFQALLQPGYVRLQLVDILLRLADVILDTVKILVFYARNKRDGKHQGKYNSKYPDQTEFAFHVSFPFV